MNQAQLNVNEDFYKRIRDKFNSRVESVRKTKNLPDVPKGVNPTCDHEWKKYKENIPTENSKFNGYAYFIVRGCVKCKSKQRVNYIIEG